MKHAKKIIAWILAMAMVLWLMPAAVFAERAEFAGGSGTAADPYLISEKSHLNNVRKYPGAHFKMVQDVVFSAEDFAAGGDFHGNGEGWVPIGDEATPFTGVFDGGGKEIRNLQICMKSDDTVYAGLFGYNKGTIKNLGMTGGAAAAAVSSESFGAYAYVGGIAGRNDRGTISGCYNTGSVSGIDAGGIAGYNDGTIVSCYNTGNINAAASASYFITNAGGIAGDNSGTISDCYNIGSVSALETSNTSISYAIAGGIAGYNDGFRDGRIVNCYNAGSVAGTYAAGIAGCSDGTIVGCSYLDTLSAGVASGTDAGTKCTAAQLMVQSTFAGCDFENIWTMGGNGDYLYPELKAAPMQFTRKLVSVAISKIPQKTEYLESTDKLDVTGGEITAQYNNGAKETIPMTEEMVTGLDNERPGRQELTVTYEGCTAAYSVTVVYEYGGGNYLRLAGKNRYETAFAAAEELKEILGAEKFENIIIAYGGNFADALAGSYLAAVKNAPILLVDSYHVEKVGEYIGENLSEEGTVYILGGTGSVPKEMEAELAGCRVKRFGGKNRYETNLMILEEAGVEGKDILVATGLNFADSLSGSAVGLPILLVGSRLTAEQKAFLETTDGNIFILGGSGSVSEEIAGELAAYGAVTRLGGKNRYETAVLIAEEFFEAPKAAMLAYALNFPDGLCGGALAYQKNAPMLLVIEGAGTQFAAEYAEKNRIGGGYLLGGSGVISDAAAKAVFG